MSVAEKEGIAMRRALILLTALSFPLSANAAAQTSPSCPSAPVAAPPPFTAWLVPGDAVSSSQPTALTIGQAATVALAAVESLRWAHPPERAPAAGTRGAVFELRIEAAGTYAIALGDAIWLDVVGADGMQRSVAHGHGPPCTNIRKVVDFALQPGTYRLQLSGAQVERSRILVVGR